MAPDRMAPDRMAPYGGIHRHGSAAAQVRRGTGQAAPPGRQRPVPPADRRARALPGRSVHTTDRTGGHHRSPDRGLRRRGFAGLVAAARLREAGVDVRIIEKGGGFGGTWYWNRYPGAQCDTASMVYMPLLEETGHMPTEKYVHGPEILAHCQRIGKMFGLYSDALFHTEVTGLAWDGARWVLSTSRGDRLTAQFVVLGAGPLSVPKLPGI